uniref:Uncharacterized protein n=1 Tax=Malurus cyaneus samueli TaxID=2593467 RepID=A0A8C5UFT6_9PASS
MLDLYALAALVQYCSEILCALTPLFNISAPSVSSSCYGDISALQAPTISCTPVRTSDCGMYHSLLDLSNSLYLTERCFTFCYCQIRCGGEARGLDSGVSFSHCAGYAMIRRTAEADLVRLRRYEIPIKRVARNLCLDPALIGAIMSQESRVGLVVTSMGPRLGVQQLQPYVVWDSEEHINQCSNILVLSINEVRARHPTWSWDRQLRGMGLADPCSRDYNYVNSVIRRAQYFKRNGF